MRQDAPRLSYSLSSDRSSKGDGSIPSIPTSSIPIALPPSMKARTHARGRTQPLAHFIKYIQVAVSCPSCPSLMPLVVAGTRTSLINLLRSPRCHALEIEGHAEVHVSSGVEASVAVCDAVLLGMARPFGEGSGGWEADADGLARGADHVRRVSVEALKCLSPANWLLRTRRGECVEVKAQQEEEDVEEDLEEKRSGGGWKRKEGDLWGCSGGRETESGEEGGCTGGGDSVGDSSGGSSGGGGGGWAAVKGLDFFSVLGPGVQSSFAMHGTVVCGHVTGWQQSSGTGRGVISGSMREEEERGRDAYAGWRQKGWGKGVLEEEDEGGLLCGVSICMVRQAIGWSQQLEDRLARVGVGLLLAAGGDVQHSRGKVCAVSEVSLRELVAVGDATGASLHDDLETALASLEAGADGGDRVNAVLVRQGWTSRHMTARGERVRGEGAGACIAVMPVLDPAEDGEAKGRRKRRRRCTVIACGPSRVHVQGVKCAVSTCLRRMANAAGLGDGAGGVLAGGGASLIACEDALRKEAATLFREDGDDRGDGGSSLVRAATMHAIADALGDVAAGVMRRVEDEGCTVKEAGQGCFESTVVQNGGCDDLWGTMCAVRRAADLTRLVLAADTIIFNNSAPG